MSHLDIVIPLGTGSVWHNNELRYSLRGLTAIDDLYLIGEKPDWLDCGHIKHQDGNAATLNIWNKVKKACESSEISDPFLFANDDFFYLKPLDPDYPNYYGQVTGNSPYKKIVRKTMSILEQNGLTTYFFDVHRPMIIHKDMFLRAYEFFSFHIRIGLGLVMKSCYGNYAELEGIEVQDMKLTYWNGEPDTDMFSIGDGCINVPFKAWCEDKYPVKSKWER